MSGLDGGLDREERQMLRPGAGGAGGAAGGSEASEDESHCADAPAREDMQHQLRITRVMSVASALLGLASVAMIAAVALGPAAAPQATATSAPFLGLSAIPRVEEHGGRGWYRTSLDSQVRTEEDPESEKVDVLDAGSLVYVAETRGRRARILKPVTGWMSLQTAAGITILQPDASYQDSPDKADIEAVFRSPEVREANERLRQSAMRLTAVEKKLMKALKELEQVPKHLESKLKKVPELRQAKSAGENLAKQAAQIFKKTVKPEGAKALLDHAERNEHVRRITRSQKIRGLVKKAKAQAEAVEEAQQETEKFETSLSEASAELSRTTQELTDEVRPQVSI